MPEQTKRPAHEVVIEMIEKSYDAIGEMHNGISSALLGGMMGSLRALITILKTMLIPREHVHSIVTRLEVLTKRDRFYSQAQIDVLELISRLRADYPDAQEDVEVKRQGMREGPNCPTCGFTMQPDGMIFRCPNCSATITTTPA